ncbi:MULTISPECIES: hypothetical protein [Halomonadaceae]|uniref:hypothetical protein n=1 Tax=Halomonadaceae TaxID=28256 RepID=UPI00022D3574|nr:hypothetical protein [Halomonas sp. HAL1]EHA16199.1 hypothetical protein HAL1_07515 [Halomonas sp. HAL1]WKV95136.1 hypothetical protein Q3Y66_20815 [Halomonas sp. HAL1]|tara:strand:+ start:147 stop:491 length:345 start_codon:yes stop_codon:yes gene_type:complete
MANKNRKARRQRAIAARQSAAQKSKGSFVVNELQHLIGAEEEDVVRAARWRAKQNIYVFLMVNLVIIPGLLAFTYFTWDRAPGKVLPFIWAGYILVLVFQARAMVRFKRIIKNA